MPGGISFLLLRILCFCCCPLLNFCDSVVPNANNVIKVAHLQPNNPNIVNEPQVMEMCYQDMKERRILPSEITLQLITMESCNRLSGVEHAAFLHYLRNASVYFGPGCNNEMNVIGRLASRWNVPIIAHLSGDDALSDRTIFDTLGSVALTSATEMARSTITLLQLYGWKQIGLVKASANFERLSLHSLKNFLKDSQIEINVEIELDPYMTADEIIATGKLKLLRNRARIIIVEMGMDLHSSRNFMIAVHRSHMKSHDYVYVIPWLAHMHDHYPWEASNIEKQETKSAFDNSIVITAHGYDKKFIEEFELRFNKMTGIISSYYATLSYMSLYDALFLYGLAVRDAVEESPNQSIFLDGRKIWKKMTARQFIGVTGQVLINNKAIRVPSYATYHVKNGTMRIVVELTARLSDKHKCAISENDCSEHAAHETMSHYWGSYDGYMPNDMPKCGFDGSFCDYTNIYISIGVLAFLAVSIPLGYLFYLKEKERMLYDMNWRIPREQIRLLEERSGTKSGSLHSKTLSHDSSSLGGSLGSATKANARLSAKQAVSNGVKCAHKRYAQMRSLSFNKNELARLKELKITENENLNKFYGISFNQQNEFIVLWLLCQRGSLEDVLFNEELKISRNFQVSFAKDVVKGMVFLHSSNLRYHGFLCLQNCLVDSNWNVKLTNFVTEEIIGDKMRHNEIKHISVSELIREKKAKEAAKKLKNGGGKSVDADDDDDSEKGGKRRKRQTAEKKRENTESESRSEEEDAMNERMRDKSNTKRFIQQAPEVIREFISTKNLPAGSQAADMYSLGMVFYQILFKLEPFYERNLPPSKILQKIALASEDDQIIRPSFPNQQQTAATEEAYNLQLLSALEACWLELPEMRPNIKRVKAIVNANLKSTGSGSLVDQMMKMMEDYTTNLEQLVKERTVLLEEAQQQADRLLKNMLPASVADDLKAGRAVPPLLYLGATVLFSDIRGFTRMASSSTPLQVVNFLNDLFSGFDAIIAKHDAYKVETIGDAYMIVSGVPRENGNCHVQHIGDIALKMRSFVTNFKVAHRPDEIMMVRIGFHSGSVAAGVVGLAAPRYCLFGDTVNVASRMESSGVANKIQGKGECTTFFLEGKEQSVPLMMSIGAGRKKGRRHTLTTAKSMFLIAKIVRGRRLLQQLEQEEEKAQKERDKIMAAKAGGGAGGTTLAGRSSRQQQTRQNSQAYEETGGGRVGGTDGASTALEHHHSFSAGPSSSSAAVGAGIVGASGRGGIGAGTEHECAAAGSIELNELGTELLMGAAGRGEDVAEKTPFALATQQQKLMNKSLDGTTQRRQKAVRQRTDSSLPSVDEELFAPTESGQHNVKMRRTSSMPSVVESDSHQKIAFSVSKKAGGIHRPIKHYNYEDRLSKLHKRALRFTWQRLQTRNGGKRIEAVFEEVFDRMMRSLPVMREMFNTRTFISAMSRCEIATPRDHVRLIVKMFETAIKNLEVEERKRTDTAADFDPNLLGRAHGALRPYGFNSSLWEAFGEAVIDVVLQAWVVLTACLVDQLRAGFESSRECPFQKAQQQQMNGTGGVAPADGTNRQQQQLCRLTSAKSNKTVGEGEEAEVPERGSDERLLVANHNSNNENRRNTIASCSDSPCTDEEEPTDKTTLDRRMDAGGGGGGTPAVHSQRQRALSIKRRGQQQRCFSVMPDRMGSGQNKLEMKILHDMTSTEL
ncbi:hypothetical protein GPALN_007900 [Globodera pallida]|nr:hypothetical protein GPALN_007900 [Globodera pallida]